MPVNRFHFSSRARGANASLPPTLPIPGYGPFRYDTLNLSPASAERALEGLEADFIFHSLESVTDDEDDQNTCIAFQLLVPIAVRVYDPAVQPLQQIRVTCNCTEYRNTRSACAHLYWVFTRLNALLIKYRQENQQETNTQEPTPIEVVSELGALYPLIEQHRESLSRDLYDQLESNFDALMTENIIHDNTMDDEPADIYEPSSSSTEIPRHGSNNGF